MGTMSSEVDVLKTQENESRGEVYVACGLRNPFINTVGSYMFIFQE